MSSEQWSEWIDWDGEGCPVDQNQIVEIRFGNGQRQAGAPQKAKFWDWRHSGHRNDFSNIIAYRYRLDSAIETPEEQEELDRIQKRMEDESVKTTTKQLRYLDSEGRDWVDECAATMTIDEFRGAMKFTIGKYLRRAGKKDDLESEIAKIEDYAKRWAEYEAKINEM